VSGLDMILVALIIASVVFLLWVLNSQAKQDEEIQREVNGYLAKLRENKP
jgi:competence protein ComGC